MVDMVSFLFHGKGKWHMQSQGHSASVAELLSAPLSGWSRSQGAAASGLLIMAMNRTKLPSPHSEGEGGMGPEPRVSVLAKQSQNLRE